MDAGGKIKLLSDEYAQTVREVAHQEPPIDVLAVVYKRAELHAAIDAMQAEIDRLRAALTDMLSGWRYIRGAHGDLYGVGWDRAQLKAEAALSKEAEGE